MDTEIAGGKQGGRFRPGQSGNPAGRPKGARNRATLAAEALLEGEAEALTRKAIEMALGGDTNALRLCMERLLPPRRDRPISIDLPALEGPQGVQGAVGAILMALAGGEISPSDATAVMGVIEAYRKASGQEGEPPQAQLLQISFVGADGTVSRLQEFPRLQAPAQLEACNIAELPVAVRR